MSDPFKFELVSPGRLLVSAQVEQVVVPGSEGEMTVLAHHAPVLTTLRPGLLDATQLTQAVKDAEEDVADAADNAVRDRAQTKLDHLRQVQAALSL
jgi:F-type H+-transporting ATPase subunit epsilon